MELFDPALLAYCEQHSSPEDDILRHISRETNAKVLMPRMLSGHLQGKTLELFSKMLQPKMILEIGTYTGYSAICMARGLAPGGKLITLDINAELENMVRGFFAQSGLSAEIDYRIGHAFDILPGLEETFDMVFIDADKENYSNYYDLLIDKLKSGSYIIADNVLWSGKVLESSQKADQETQALKEYSEKIHNDPRVENILLTVRDGLMIARKK